MCVYLYCYSGRSSGVLCGERQRCEFCPLSRVLQSVVEVGGYSITIGSSQSRLVEILVTTVPSSGFDRPNQTVPQEPFQATAGVKSCVSYWQGLYLQRVLCEESLPVSLQLRNPIEYRSAVDWIATRSIKHSHGTHLQ